MKGVSGCIDGQGFKFGQVMSVEERGCGDQMPSGKEWSLVKAVDLGFEDLGL